MRTFAVVVAIIAVLAVYLLWQDRGAPARAIERRQAAAVRVSKGAYVATDNAISLSETVRIVIIPHPWGEFFDLRCILYNNRDTGASHFTCPEVKQDDLRNADAHAGGS